MRGVVALTDHDWYRFFLARPEIDEVNFWRPGTARFSALDSGEPFFFKLKSPRNAICGFGLFARYELLPEWQAWDLFGQANGAATEWDLIKRLARLSGGDSRLSPDRPVGCVAIAEPVFFTPDDWVAPPTDWKRQIVSGKTYDLHEGEGARIYRKCLERAEAMSEPPEWPLELLERERTGKPQLVLPRLGQNSFRLAVLDAYGKACAVTGEHALPVVEAGHIKPWARGGPHEIPNGLPLRRDLHRLFDLGFVTVEPDLRLRVSPALEDDYANGRIYYEMEGRELTAPAEPSIRPSCAFLEWHREEIFRT